MSRAPLRIMDTRNIRDTRSEEAARQRRIESKITTLAGGWAVRGISRIFADRASAIAAARKLDVG